MIHSEQMQVFKNQNEIKKNRITSQQSYTLQTCLKGGLENNQQGIREPNNINYE
jgi:hypothetical protein